MSEQEIHIDFWIAEKQEHYAARRSIHVPCIGDEVRFNGVAYKIIYRIWIYDEKRPRVALNMEEVKAQ